MFQNAQWSSIIRNFFVVLILICGITLGTGNARAASNQKTVSGTVTKIMASGMGFSSNSGTWYSVDIAGANVVRKNGSPMKLSEFKIGDKIEVKGTVWSDNSISAIFIRDLTLYAHTGTFSGKIISINPPDGSFVIQSSQPTVRTIRTSGLTSYKKNGSGARFADLEMGMSAVVKGQWERQDSEITATQVLATLRLVNIEVTGQVTMIGPNSLTVISNNTIYGVEISGATLQNKLGKVIVSSAINLGDTVKVSGKHVSGGVKITASKVKDISILK
jgi:hypothetical protein